MKATNQTIQRSFNRSLVLQKIRREGRISRVDLARALGLEKSSISAIVGELIDCGLLLTGESGEASLSGGRKPVFLELNGSFCCFMGLELQPGNYRMSLLDLNSRIIYREKGPVATWKNGVTETLHQLYEHFKPTVARLGIPLVAIGLGIPGMVNPNSGTITLSIPHSLHYWEISGTTNPWQVPSFLENDANCCAWASLLIQDPPATLDFLTILLEFQENNPLTAQEAGVSLGFGLVLNGEPYYGQRYDAGEFRSLNWRQGLRNQTGIPDHELESIARNPVVLDRYLTEVLLNLVPICSLLSPEQIILCGEAGKAMPQIQALLDGPLAASWMAQAENRRRFSTSPWGDEAVAIGAASRIIMSLFNSRSLAKTAMQAGVDWDHLIARWGRGHGKKNAE